MGTTPDPFKIMQPPPVVPIPTQPPIHTTVSDHSGPHELRHFRVEMPQGMKDDWDRNTQAVIKRKDAEAKRRMNMKLVEQTFQIEGWFKVRVFVML